MKQTATYSNHGTNETNEPLAIQKLTRDLHAFLAGLANPYYQLGSVSPQVTLPLHEVVSEN